LRAKDPLIHGQQRGVLVPGGGPVPRLPGPASEAGAGSEGGRVLRAKDPLIHGQQRGEQVAGGGRVPRLPGPAGEGGAEVPGSWARTFGVSGAPARTPRPRTGSGAASWSRAAAGPPASPVQRARLPRTARVAGCSGLDTTCSRTCSSAASRSRAAAGSPASPI